MAVLFIMCIHLFVEGADRPRDPLKQKNNAKAKTSKLLLLNDSVQYTNEIRFFYLCAQLAMLSREELLIHGISIYP